MNMALTEEHKQKLVEGRRRARAARLASETVPLIDRASIVQEAAAAAQNQCGDSSIYLREECPNQAPAVSAVAHTGPIAPPRIDVLERRLQNPFGEPSTDIRLKDPSLIPHWVNTTLRADQFWRAKEFGWVGVRPEQVTDLTQIGYYTTSVDGYITRGQRGEEILMCMPNERFQRIQLAKARKNLADTRDFDKQKRQMLDGAAAKYGGQASDYLNQRTGPIGKVTDMYERIERLEPDEPA